LEGKQQDPDKLQVFTDYRVMYDKIGKSIDAVFIAAPNHHHAPAAMLAMQLNKGVYCEKPLCHDIAEARKLREMAKRSKAPAQMGNQGHCEDGYRRLCEFIWAGVVGKITETHSWTDRANGGAGPRPPSLPPPAGLHWDEWIGPAPHREFHTDLHPHEWHGWCDFGNGSLGNMSCHVLDGVYWALKVEHPTAVEAEEIRDGSDERYPTGSRLRWDCPARGDMPALKAYWYEGLKKGASPDAAVGDLKTVKGAARNLPPLLLDLQKQYPDEEFDASGSLYVGEKGILYTATYGGRMHLLPGSLWSFLWSDVLSWRAKLGLLTERWRAPHRVVERRLGSGDWPLWEAIRVAQIQRAIHAGPDELAGSWACHSDLSHDTTPTRSHQPDISTGTNDKSGADEFGPVINGDCGEKG
jgi:hypothetical protein